MAHYRDGCRSALSLVPNLGGKAGQSVQQRRTVIENLFQLADVHFARAVNRRMKAPCHKGRPRVLAFSIVIVSYFSRSFSMKTHSAPGAAPKTIDGGSPSRSDIAALAAAGRPICLLNCAMEEVDLSNIDMTGWRFEACVLKRANFTGATLDDAAFVSCRGAFVDFTAARLVEATVEKCDFNNGNFEGAAVTHASFIGCKLTGADFTGARTNAVLFKETTLSAARLPGVSFRKSKIEHVDFSMADLAKCDFRDAIFSGSSLREAHLVDARFEGADLRGADLGGVRLHDARKFKGATISRDQAGVLLAEMGLRVH